MSNRRSWTQIVHVLVRLYPLRPRPAASPFASRRSSRSSCRKNCKWSFILRLPLGNVARASLTASLSWTIWSSKRSRESSTEARVEGVTVRSSFGAALRPPKPVLFRLQLAARAAEGFEVLRGDACVARLQLSLSSAVSPPMRLA